MEESVIPDYGGQPKNHDDLDVKPVSPFIPKSFSRRNLKGVDEDTGKVLNETFLATYLPLKVIDILPGITGVYQSEDSPQQVSGKTSITVVFNRAVIKLGSDFGPDSQIPEELIPFSLVNAENVPGKFRWVTTAIARFDPDINWPSDLNFEVRVKETLKSFDGAILDQENSKVMKRSYTTAHLSASISSVHSEKILNITNNLWNSFENSRNLHEVPPDGKITIAFRSSIDPDLVGKSITIKRYSTNSNIKFRYEKCNEVSTCLFIFPELPTTPDEEYSIRIPKGTLYHKHSGPTQSEILLSFVGLLSFNFRFLNMVDYYRPMHHTYLLWLPHSLDSKVDYQKFADVITISEKGRLDSILGRTEIDYSLERPHKSILVIRAQFKPSTTYTIDVKASESIRDGYGFPLQAHSTSFTTQEISSLFVEPSLEYPMLLFDSDFKEDWKVIARRGSVSNGGYEIGLWNVRKDDKSIETALSSLCSKRVMNFASSVRFPSKDSGIEPITLTMPEKSLFGDSGLGFVEHRYDNNYAQMFPISRSDYAVNVISLRNNTLLFWVTSISTGESVADLEILIYEYQHNWQNQSPCTVSKKSSGRLGSDGTVILDIHQEYGTLVAFIRDKDGSLAYAPNLMAWRQELPSNIWKSSIFTDRNLYRIGETVHVKGVIRNFNTIKKAYDSSSLSEANVVISWNPSNSETNLVNIDLTYGTFETTFIIPEDTEYGMKMIQLYFSNTNSYASILIADPRIPTGVMEFSTKEKVFKPRVNAIPLDFKTETYSGSPVETTVTLRWSLSGGSVYHSDIYIPYLQENSFKTPSGEVIGMEHVPKSPKPKTLASGEEKGEITVQTDSSGKVTYLFKLPDSMIDQVAEGRSIDFEAEWIGPTREKITKTLNVPISNSEWEVSLSLTLSDPLPGFQFGARVNLYDFQMPKFNEEIKLELFSWDGKLPLDKDPKTGDIPNLSKLESIGQCSAVSDGGKTSQCEFKLPNIGKYLLIGSARDSTGYLVTTAIPLGKTLEEWNSQPLRKFESLTMIADKPVYNLGDEAKLSFYFPYQQGIALITWGSAYGLQKSQQKLQHGEETILIPIGDECSFGCSVAVTINVPKNSDLSLPIEIPISKLFDPKNAKPFFLNQFLSVAEPKSRNVELSLNLEKPVVTPGSETTISVSLRREDGSPIEGEVTLWMVDKAVFDLSPIGLNNLSQELSVAEELQYSGTHVMSTLSHLATNKAYKNAYDAIIRRAKMDPWLNFVWPLKPTEWEINQLEMDDETYMKKLHFLITKFPSFSEEVLTLGGELEFADGGAVDNAAFVYEDHGAPAKMKLVGSAPALAQEALFSPAAPMRQSADAATAAQAAPASPSPPVGDFASLLRSNFQTTPLFKTIKVPTSGDASLKITMPDNIGSYLVRAIAVTKEEQFGGAETELTTRRQLSLQPSVPRIVRIGDDFYAGVTVQLQPLEEDGSSKLQSVSVQVEVVAEQGLTLISSQTQKVSVPYFTPQEVLFHFKASQYGEASLQFSASCSTSQDAVEVSIPILALQDSVFVATSFAMEQKEGNSPWIEGIDLPDAVEGTGNFSIEAGVGRLPSILLLSEGLFSLLDKYQHGDTILGSLAPKGALHPYESATSSMKKTLEERFQKSVQLLRLYTDNYVGLVYYKERYGPYTPTVDCYLNAYGLLLDSLLSRNGAQLPSDLTAIWRRSLENGLIELASQARRYKYVFNDFNLIALSRLVLGSTWRPNANNEIVDDLAFSRLSENLDKCGVFCKAVTGLIYIRENQPSKNLQQISSFLESSFRVQGRTAYVASDLTSGSPYPAGTTENAFSLSVLVNRNLSNPLVEKLANYLSKNAATNGFSSISTALTAFALSEYDLLKGSTSPNVDLSVSSGTRKILSQKFDTAAQPPIKRTWNWEALERDHLSQPLPLQFGVQGKGEISVALGLNFIPRKIFDEPIYRGIYVEKVISNIDPFTHEATGGAVFNSTPGTTVKVTIQISTPDDLSNVMIVDLLPGGLEAMDPNITPEKSGHSSSTMGYEGIYRGKRRFRESHQRIDICYWCWWTAFPSRETRKDRVMFSSNWLHAGTHTVSYEALVVTSGSFSLPPTKAYVLAQPEVMGLSSGGTFFVEQRE